MAKREHLTPSERKARKASRQAETQKGREHRNRVILIVFAVAILGIASLYGLNRLTVDNQPETISYIVQNYNPEQALPTAADGHAVIPDYDYLQEGGYEQVNFGGESQFFFTHGNAELLLIDVDITLPGEEQTFSYFFSQEKFIRFVGRLQAERQTNTGNTEPRPIRFIVNLIGDDAGAHLLCEYPEIDIIPMNMGRHIIERIVPGINPEEIATSPDLIGTYGNAITSLTTLVSRHEGEHATEDHCGHDSGTQTPQTTAEAEARQAEFTPQLDDDAFLVVQITDATRFADYTRYVRGIHNLPVEQE